jgi:hypothetical protein
MHPPQSRAQKPSAPIGAVQASFAAISILDEPSVTLSRAEPLVRATFAVFVPNVERANAPDDNGESVADVPVPLDR